MTTDYFSDGAPVGRDASAPAPAARRTSSAFGSPGTDSTVKRIDLNDALIKHPDATFVMRAAGGAMHGAGIHDGDVLLVDRAVTASHGAVVIAVVDGELLCRRLEVSSSKPGRTAGRACLVAADSATSPVDVGHGQLEVWGGRHDRHQVADVLIGSDVRAHRRQQLLCFLRARFRATPGRQACRRAQLE